MFAGFERLDGPLGVQAVGQGIVDRVDVMIRKQGAIGLVDARDVMLLCKAVGAVEVPGRNG